MLRKREEEKTRRTDGHQGEGREPEVRALLDFAHEDALGVVNGVEIPSILQDIEASSVFHDGDSSLDTFINVPSGTVSPTSSSISIASGLASSELGQELEHGENQTATRHDNFYFEDGNIEIACGSTIFRVHSSVISFSPSDLREIISQLAPLNAPTPEGCPRITIPDSAEDFAILLQMIYTPGSVSPSCELTAQPVTRFPARHEVPEFSVFASLLRMTTKYGFSIIRDQLVKDLEGAYPTKWEDFRSAKVLGEDAFGSPKPHPNAVLNLFEAQNLTFAFPFAAYRASVGGFQALISNKPGTVLSRPILASTVRSMRLLSVSVSKAARMVTYGGYLWVCPDKACTPNVDLNPVEKRMEALEKIYIAMIDKREGGPLSSPSLKRLLCTKCAKNVEASHAVWGSFFWENLPPVFGLPRGWDDL